MVITRWRNEESFQAWLGSESFTQGHRAAAARQGGATHDSSTSPTLAQKTEALRGLIAEWIELKG